MRMIEFGIEEIILFLIVVLNVLDAVEILPPDLDYIKKLISWSALGYLFYKTHPSKILFGHKKPGLDTTLLIAYLFMIVTFLVSYAISVTSEAQRLGKSISGFLAPLYDFLISNATLIDMVGLYIGLFLLLGIAIRFALQVPITSPSVMSILFKKSGTPKKFFPFLWRVCATYFVLLAFFIIAFNLVMEWLAIAIDAPLLMIGLATYIFFIIRHKEKFSPGSFLARFGDFGSRVYQDVIEHFKYKKTIFRAVGVMLVLHILTEALHFLWPWVFGRQDALYFGLLTAPHPSALATFTADSVGLALSSKFALGAVLLGNGLGMLFLLLFPGLLWYLLYKNRPFHPTRTFLGVVFFSLITMALAPAFSLRPIRSSLIAGVDIAGKSVTSSMVLPLEWTVMIAMAMAIFVVIVSSRLRAERFLFQTLIHVSQVFFTVYIAMFFFSVARYYLITIGILGMASRIVLAAAFILFFAITALFYIFGLFGFLADTEAHIKEHVRY